MKILKVALFLALGGIAAQSFANDSQSMAEAGKTPVERYT